MIEPFREHIIGAKPGTNVIENDIRWLPIHHRFSLALVPSYKATIHQIGTDANHRFRSLYVGRFAIDCNVGMIPALLGAISGGKYGHALFG
ncbi:hypothetical protein [Kordiimonas gwangyangensis]|uniref:hypothetical protein n=1 Tax=Kordiimonas gwangyangensis TaxID=288022 RepID=UPI0012DDBD10|nr:hypothetical protein [Kordiimonas gwangyangensis]